MTLTVEDEETEEIRDKWTDKISFNFLNENSLLKRAKSSISRGIAEVLENNRGVN